MSFLDLKQEFNSTYSTFFFGQEQLLLAKDGFTLLGVSDEQLKREAQDTVITR